MYGEDLSDADEEHREGWSSCTGCRRIAERWCPGGHVLGQLAENVEYCLGFDYRDDPAEWDDEDVDAEDARNRAALAKPGDDHAHH